MCEERPEDLEDEAEVSDPHEVLLDMARAREEIEPFRDPQFWLDRFIGTPEEDLGKLFETVFKAGEAAGRLEVMTRHFIDDQDWFERVRKTLGIDESS